MLINLEKGPDLEQSEAKLERFRRKPESERADMHLWLIFGGFLPYLLLKCLTNNIFESYQFSKSKLLNLNFVHHNLAFN